jgi:hypothetical protein
MKPKEDITRLIKRWRPGKWKKDGDLRICTWNVLWNVNWRVEGVFGDLYFDGRMEWRMA